MKFIKKMFSKPVPPSIVTIDANAPMSGELKKLEGYSSEIPQILCVHEKDEHNWTTLIHTAQKVMQHRELLIELTIRGYHIYKAHEDGSLLVHQHHLSSVWPKIISGEYLVNDDFLVYQITPPVDPSRRISRMLVLLSSVNTNRFTQQLDRHFMINFPSIGKHILDDTLILRIADLGGVVGSYYLPTRFDEKNTNKHISLIRSIAEAHQIDEKRIVLYGASKGGTGALYISLVEGFPCVAVDPILSSREKDNDPYFSTTRIFTHDRTDLFYEAAQRSTYTSATLPPVNIITSPSSREFSTIMSLVQKTRIHDYTRVISSNNPKITAHHDVSKNTISIALLLINSLLGRIGQGPGVTEIE